MPTSAPFLSSSGLFPFFQGGFLSPPIAFPFLVPPSYSSSFFVESFAPSNVACRGGMSTPSSVRAIVEGVFFFPLFCNRVFLPCSRWHAELLSLPFHAGSLCPPHILFFFAYDPLSSDVFLHRPISPYILRLPSAWFSQFEHRPPTWLSC